MSQVTFIDTSILCELVGVPGKSQQPLAMRAELARRMEAGQRFVIPITAVIETGNHIAQGTGDRRGAALRLDGLLRRAIAGDSPFVLNQVAWDDAFLTELCNGNATHQTLVDLAGNGQLGAGDVAILVERDRFVAASAFSGQEVTIWTQDQRLRAYA